jgi:uncharacterized damage-inducible protein DinB
MEPDELHPLLLPCWEFGDRVRDDLLATTRPVSPAQWSFRTGTASWSIAQVVDHLLRAEIGTSKMVRKLIRGDYRTWPLPAGQTLYTAELDRYPYGQLTAPQELNPGPTRDQAELERELGVAHARFHAELERFRGEDPEVLRSPDPATGVWYTLGGWVKLQAWHETHHVSQVRGILATPGFPAA